MLVVDLFCGLGGFSQAFRDRGHRVIGVDIVPPADVLADVKALPFNRRLRPDVVLASPPCTEFTKHSMPWREGKPDGDLVGAALGAIMTWRPRWWVLENVRGSRPYIGSVMEPTMRIGSRYLWGRFPLVMVSGKCEGKWKMSPSPERARLRSKIPTR